MDTSRTMQKLNRISTDALANVAFRCYDQDQPSGWMTVSREFGCWRRAETLTEESRRMAEGTIKKLAEKGFGFIDTGNGNDIFFHLSNLEETSFDQLTEGARVSFNEGVGPKGPRAENVRLID